MFAGQLLITGGVMEMEQQFIVVEQDLVLETEQD